MKFLLIPFILLATVCANAQYQQQLHKCKTDTGAPKERFLDSLLQLIGNKRIVALGEDTHGTAEFQELRAAITQRLIQEKGFNIVVLENPHEDLLALQQGLQTEPLDTLMQRHLFSIYQTKQMQTFLNWFKNYSKERPALRLAGCDDSFRDIIAQQLVKETAKYSNDSINNLCREFLLRQTLSIKEFYARKPEQKSDTLPSSMQFNLATYRLLNKIDSICQRQQQQDPLLKELIFHALSSLVYYDRFSRKMPVSRDELMGNRITYYAANPNAKIVVWAHNAHIARYAWLYNEIGLMGATVLKAHPNDYIAIGLSGGQGTYSYIKNRFINDDHRYTDSLFTGTLHNCKKGSWNQLLLGNSAASFLLDFSKLNTTERNQFDKARPLKLLGYGKESDTHKEYYDVSLTRLFDALIFLKETTHTTTLFN